MRICGVDNTTNKTTRHTYCNNMYEYLLPPLLIPYDYYYNVVSLNPIHSLTQQRRTKEQKNKEKKEKNRVSLRNLFFFFMYEYLIMGMEEKQ